MIIWLNVNTNIVHGADIRDVRNLLQAILPASVHALFLRARREEQKEAGTDNDQLLPISNAKMGDNPTKNLPQRETV